MSEFCIDRFCSIEGTRCKKKFFYKGSKSFFIAYPFSPHWQDFYSELVNELRSKGGFIVNSWEGSVKNDLLFSKVCEGIYSHSFLLAEVTEPNLNVLLEIGYALSVGRMPILLMDNNRMQWSRNLLATLENCRYETRRDIQQYLDSFLRRDDIPNEPVQRLPFLDRIGIYEENEVPDTVYHLKPRVSTDWINRVDSVLELNRCEERSLDSTYDKFYPQALNIKRASLVVSSLLGPDYVDWEQHNANVALLTGFAIGLGKRVLVMQYKPRTPILDLGSMLHPVETESQAEQIVKSWINSQLNPIHVESSSACVELKRWEWDSIPYEHRDFQMGTEKVSIPIHDYYVYRRHDKLRIAPWKDSEIRLYWKSSGLIGDTEGSGGTKVEEDPVERETSRHRDRVGLIFPISPDQEDLNFLVPLYNDLRNGFKHVSIKTFEGVWTGEMEIKVDFTAVPDTEFVKMKPRAVFRHKGQEPGKEIEVNREGNVWFASYRPLDGSPIYPGSTIQLSWEKEEARPDEGLG